MKKVTHCIDDKVLAARGLPELAYVDNADRRYHEDARVIGLRRGEAGFHPIYVNATADQLNAGEGISAEQREAMLWGSMFGWETPGADPNSEVVKKLARGRVN